LHRQASLDLRLRDPAGEMELEGEPRIGPLVGSGRGGRAADFARPRLDVARERRIAGDRPVESVTAPVLRE
jgi:hypothetical protein